MSIPKTDLTGLQLAIMRVLWTKGEASSREVQEDINRDLALTTVSTMLSRLEDDKVVTHRSQGRRYLYRALVNQDEIRRSAVRDVVETLFGGRTTQLVSHLLKESEVSPGEVDRVIDLIRQHEEKERSSSKGGETS